MTNLAYYIVPTEHGVLQYMEANRTDGRIEYRHRNGTADDIISKDQMLSRVHDVIAYLRYKQQMLWEFRNRVEGLE